MVYVTRPTLSRSDFIALSIGSGPVLVAAVLKYIIKEPSAEENEERISQRDIFEIEASNLETIISENEKNTGWFEQMHEHVKQAIKAYKTYSADDLQELKERVLSPFIDYVLEDVRQRKGAGGPSYRAANIYLDNLEKLAREDFPERLPEILELRREIEAKKPKETL